MRFVEDVLIAPMIIINKRRRPLNCPDALGNVASSMSANCEISFLYSATEECRATIKGGCEIVGGFVVGVVMVKVTILN